MLFFLIFFLNLSLKELTFNLDATILQMRPTEMSKTAAINYYNNHIFYGTWLETSDYHKSAFALI